MIVWHGEALHSCDFQPNSNTLATTGINEDRDYLRIWKIEQNQNKTNLSKNNTVPLNSSYQSKVEEIKKEDDGVLFPNHFKILYQYSVRISTPYAGNMLRFSPNAKHLAFASDSECLFVLCKRMLPLQIGSSQYVLKWGEDKSLRGHLGSVLAVSWLPCSDFLVSGSIDNTIIIWNLAKNNIQQRIQGFQSYVSGIAVDPRGEYMTVQSNDQSIRVYQVGSSSRNLKFYPQEQHQKIRDFDIQNMEECDDQKGSSIQQQLEDVQPCQNIKRNHRFIQNELEFNHFYRRLDWSPDGKFYLTTSTFMKQEEVQEESNIVFGSYLFVRELPEIPLLCIGDFNQSITCVKFCKQKFHYEPEYFASKHEGDIELKCQIQAEGIIQLEFAYVFAIASTNEVKIFSTACTTPLAVLRNIHADCIVDLSWSGDKFLTIVSLDAFLTICSFEEGFFGRRVQQKVKVVEDNENMSIVGNATMSIGKVEDEKQVKMMITSKTGKKINISKVQI